MFLTKEELEELTGYQLPGWQCRWLKAHKWKFERSATGRPIVLRAYAASQLSDQPAVNEPVMNLAVIKRRA